METANYFSKIATIDPTFIAILTLFVIVSLLSILALYSIIWFEHFGNDSKRTIVNQMVSGVCWTLIQTTSAPPLIDITR